jgi:hypothetical protein
MDTKILADLCSSHMTTVLWIGRAFLFVALAVATTAAVLALIQGIVALFKPSPASTKGREAGGNVDAAAKFLDALKGLVASLAAAPPWFAMFLAGVLLLWMAGNAAPAFCAR